MLRESQFDGTILQIKIISGHKIDYFISTSSVENWFEDFLLIFTA